MVVFTCNNCGDSVNKPKVDKHVQYECKRKYFAVSLCCVDCLIDFNYDTAKDHCQCVTEEQRYSAKGFVPKASSEKGKRKQCGWVDIVQSLIDSKDLSNDERQFLNVIGKYDNVPRKKNKFQNFCFSSAPAYRKKGYLIDKVFDMIEAKYKAEQTQISKPPTDVNNISDSENQGKINSIQEESQKIDEKMKTIGNDKKITHEIIDHETEETPKKKKKKSKQSLDAVNDNIEKKSEDNDELQSEKKKQKKEKKLLKNNIVSETHSEVKDTENNEDAQLGSTKKSKKIKNNSDVDLVNHINENGDFHTKKTSKDNSLTNEVNGILLEKTDSQMTKKEKKEMKKKLKYQHELASVANGIIETDKEPISKKKKRKLNDNEENEEPQQKILKTEETSKVPELQSGRKFDWNEAINQVLLRKKSKPMSQSKVMKRVMNEYYSLNETIKKTESELEKIFLKKLRKMKNVVIDNDKVKLIEC